MANQLKMAVQQTVVALAQHVWSQCGWSQRRITDELGVNRETVARDVRSSSIGRAPRFDLRDVQ